MSASMLSSAQTKEFKCCDKICKIMLTIACLTCILTADNLFIVDDLNWKKNVP